MLNMLSSLGQGCAASSIFDSLFLAASQKATKKRSCCPADLIVHRGYIGGLVFFFCFRTPVPRQTTFDQLSWTPDWTGDPISSFHVVHPARFEVAIKSLMVGLCRRHVGEEPAALCCGTFLLACHCRRDVGRYHQAAPHYVHVLAEAAKPCSVTSFIV